MLDTVPGQGNLKESRIGFVCWITFPLYELGAVVSLDAFNREREALDQAVKKKRSCVRTVFLVNLTIPEPGKLVNGSKLIEPEIRICNARPRDELYINLNTLAGILHLLIGLPDCTALDLATERRCTPNAEEHDRGRRWNGYSHAVEV